MRKEIRFSPQWVMNDHDRLGLSAKNYGLLVGVGSDSADGEAGGVAAVGVAWVNWI